MSEFITTRNGSIWSRSGRNVQLPTDDINHLYTLSDTNGTVVDDLNSSGSGFDETSRSGSYVYFAESFGSEVMFYDGSDDYIKFDGIASTFSGKDSISVSVWLIFDRVDDSTKQDIWRTNNTWTMGSRFNAAADPNEVDCWAKDSDGNVVKQRGSIGEVSQGDTLLFSASYKRDGYLTLWLTWKDGTKENEPIFSTNNHLSETYDYPLADTNELLLGGKDTSGTNAFTGSVGPWVVWDKAIKHEEHYQFFEATRPLL